MALPQQVGGGTGLLVNVRTELVEDSYITTLDMTYNEIVTAIESGNVPVAIKRSLKGGSLGYITAYGEDDDEYYVTIDNNTFYADSADGVLSQSGGR